ncbi:H3 K56 histone acetylation protein KAT11 [Colletotrichum higginsianum]|nr:H3 K56 histone acetylation protein KAT11 [Colletotrichum higginsianum]
MSTPRKLFPQAQSATPSRTKPEKPERKKKKKKTKLTGVIKPRQPRIKTQQRNYLLDKPISTAYYYWPAEGRGRKIVDENDYKRVNELLLRLDFSKLDIATRSTRRWISEVGMGDSWGLEVLGKRDTLVSSSNESSAGAVNNLASLIKRKRTEETVANESDEPASKVNVLSTGLIRRKAKEEPAAVIVAAEAKGGELPKANVLGAGLVRK